jgi:hypothetical protein
MAYDYSTLDCRLSGYWRTISPQFILVDIASNGGKFKWHSR